MKRKTLTLTLCLLSCLALIGVGFAAWVITSNTEASKEGNIMVDTVTDNRLTVTTDWLDSKDSIVFGWKDGSYTNGWLQNNDSTKKESLEVTLVVTVKDANGNFIDDANISATVSGDDQYTAAKTAGLVGDLPTGLTAVKQEGAPGVYHITITFTWGTTFEGKNPSEFYNNQGYTVALADAAKTNLEALETLSNTKFTVNLVVTPATAN